MPRADKNFVYTVEDKYSNVNRWTQNIDTAINAARTLDIRYPSRAPHTVVRYRRADEA